MREVALDLATPAAAGTGMTVTSVTSNGQTVAFTHLDNRLRLPVADGAETGREFSFTIAYQGAVRQTQPRGG